MGSFPEAYNDPTWIIIRRLSNHFCRRNIEIFWTYILLFLVHFLITARFPCSYILEYMHYTYFKRGMEECLKSGINLLLIFVLSYSLARHSILWKNAFETIQAVFWSFCFAIKNHNGPKRRRTSRTMRHSVPDVKYPLPKFGRTQKAKLGL